ncbi:MAG: 2-hydroxyacyl-CoA dehydratase family protein [Bacillota bacterium]
MVLTSCSYIPLEIPLALGIPAKRAFFEAPLASCEACLPRDFCPYAKAFIRQHSPEDILAIAGSCDAMRRVYDVLRHFGYAREVYFVDVPRTSSSDAVAFYAGILREFARYLIRVRNDMHRCSSGCSPSSVTDIRDPMFRDRLLATARSLNSLRMELARIFRLQGDGCVSGREAVEVALRVNENLARETAAEELKGALVPDEEAFRACQAIIESAVPRAGRSGWAPGGCENGKAPEESQNERDEAHASDKRFRSAGSATGRKRPEAGVLRRRVRVGISATCLLEPVLVESLEDAGFSVVFIDSCLPSRMFNFSVPGLGTCDSTSNRSDEDARGNADVFQSLALGYLRKPPCPRLFAGHARTEHLKRLVASSGAQGLVYFAPKFCDLAYYDFSELKQVLGETGNLPMILIEGEYGSGKAGQTLTRAIAFKEMLEGRSSSGEMG